MKKNFNSEEIQKKLLSKRNELLNESIKLTTITDNFNDVRDLGDEAYAISSQTLQRSIGEADVNEIKLIDLALSQLESGKYGICTDCEGDISEARLTYYPYAIRCIVCQEAHDL